MENDKSEIVEINNQMKAILDGIPDIIKIHKPDHSVCFFNKAGYDFYKKTPDQIIGHKCYEALDRDKRCSDCFFDQAVEKRKQVSHERYIPELNKVMDVCYNPVFDENGKVRFVVERLTDITEKKIVNKINMDSRKKYMDVMDKIPDPLIIIVDNKIVETNLEACKLFGENYDKIINKSIYRCVEKKYIKPIHRKFQHVLSNRKRKEIFEYEFTIRNEHTFIMQITLSFMLYERQPAILAILRDVTKLKLELKKASLFQKSSLQKEFPLTKYADYKRVYVPAHIVSGDFYRLCPINDHSIIGIIIDVRGKGISAALNISALDVLAYQEINEGNYDPLEIVKALNGMLSDYYEENYIAICCFKIDFKEKKLEAVGAGINRFFYKSINQDIQEITVKGPFLGMFKMDNLFSKTTINLNSGDKLFFFTDGLDFILDENKCIKKYMNEGNISDVTLKIEECIDKDLLYDGKIKDDCTLLSINIK